MGDFKRLNTANIHVNARSVSTHKFDILLFDDMNTHCAYCTLVYLLAIHIFWFEYLCVGIVILYIAASPKAQYTLGLT